jgi:hypothetical protein
VTATSDLVAAATVGTAHRSVDLAALPEQFRPNMLQDDAAGALLDAAALSAVARRTVLPAVPGATGPAVRPVTEHRQVVPDVVRQVLGRVSNQPAVLLEALVLIDRAKLRLPPALVPGLLDDPRAEVVAATRPVSGDIGRLLMAKNPRWTKPAVPDLNDRTMWDEGTSAQRLNWLRSYRRADPNAARQLLLDNFSQLSAIDRANLLEVLADGLSSADEEFLMAAVNDRSRLVEAAAIALLCQLPGSALRKDMRTLAARHLTLGRRLLRTSTITIGELSPQEFAPWPFPDGAPWTVLISRIDPAEWPEIFRGDLLRLVAGGADELQPLGPGFRLAAIAFNHSGLAQTLITRMFVRAGLKAPPTVDRALWAVLNGSDATAQLDRLLAHPLTVPDHVTAAATALGTPWPAALARRLVRWLPTGGVGRAPAPRHLWDLVAGATALPNCREIAENIRALVAAASVDSSADPDRRTLTTRASNATNLLILRAVLFETLPVPGGHE